MMSLKPINFPQKMLVFVFLLTILSLYFWTSFICKDDTRDEFISAGVGEFVVPPGTVGEVVDSGNGLAFFRGKNIKELTFCFSEWERTYPSRAGNIIARFSSIDDLNRDFFQVVIRYKTPSECCLIVAYRE